ncbi:MAG TPA: glycosyltransferase family 4 protein [Tepidisphaeraceae bacterium]|jgi:glycosyltransferase involved in cell wall biosynthesis
MNRLITSDIRQATPHHLPPAQRENRTRILFINWLSLGFSTQARQFKKYADLRDDIDAVHLDIRPPLWAKILHKRIQAIGHWDFASYRILKIWGWLVGRWLRRIDAFSRFDVIQIMTQGIGLPVARHGGAGRPGHHPRFAVYIDATSTLEVREHGIPALARAPFIAAERRIFGHADLIVAMSQWAANSVISDYSIPRSRVQITPGCVTLPEPKAQGFALRIKPRIIFIAHDWKLKGGPLLLSIHQRSLVGKAELHIVSRSAPKTPLPDVVWHGGMPWEELMVLIQQMDILCHPTRLDMMCWAIVEAITAGLPVVSTRMAAIPEMVVDGQTGFLCAKDDEAAFESALLKLVTDPALRANMSAATRKHAMQHYQADTVYNALMDRLCALGE